MNAIIILSSFRILYTLFVCTLTVWLLYTLNIFTAGWFLLPFLFSLLLSGLFIGFFTTAFVMCWGRKALFFSWTISWFFSPFSSVYYPLDSSQSPTWVWVIGKMLPMSYAFDGIRALVKTHQFLLYEFSMSVALNVVYLIASMIFFAYMFERSRVKGFTSLQ
jgi:ABC-2 type transport system permease protein